MPDYRREARRAARRYGLDPRIFERQIGAESDFDEEVITGRRVSPAGARGIAQIMPDTAKGWGVDPLDPIAALDAAAKNMAEYVEKYGGYENALRAYNAGPGAIEASRGYSETNNYVQKILNGRDPGKLGSVMKSNPASVDNRPSTRLSEIQRPQAPNYFSQIAAMTPMQVGGTNPMMQQLQATTRRNWELMGQIQDQLNAPDPIQPTTAATVKPSDGLLPSTTKSKPGKKVDGTPYEFFFDPLGGWDNGTSTGAIGGHDTHLHFAAPIEMLKAVAEEAKAAGLSVREFEPYDKVDPVHTDGSWHYKGLAADISGPGLMEFAKRMKKRYGLK